MLSQRSRIRSGSSWFIDVLFVIVLGVSIFTVVTLASGARTSRAASDSGINLSPALLPLYAILSVGRMLAAYLLAMAFSLSYGYVAAYNRRASGFMIPILDILQSVPILSFMPVAVLAMIAIFHNVRVGTEVAAILLIFTSQAWNLTFSFYHSIRDIPPELREISTAFGLIGWPRFRYLELPASAVGLVWNSMMSWDGGWFFIMASEMFALGNKSFQLPGLGSYLQIASREKNFTAVAYGLITLVVVIILLNRFVWQPLVIWANKFKIEDSRGEEEAPSALLRLGARSKLAHFVTSYIIHYTIEFISKRIYRPIRKAEEVTRRGLEDRRVRYALAKVIMGLAVIALLYGVYRAINLLSELSLANLWYLLRAAAASTARVATAQILALAWTLPVGIWIGLNPKVARRLQAVIQVSAAIPATALFPVILILLIGLPFGLNLGAVLLMMWASQWYLLYNIIAGASQVPQNLREVAQYSNLKGFALWRVLVLPTIAPSLVTGLVTSAGAAWNATIVAEYIRFSGEAPDSTIGLGSAIAQAASNGDLATLLAATLLLVGIVVSVNRFLWRRIQRAAEEKFRLEAT